MNLRLKTLLASSIATVGLVIGLSVGLSYLVLRQISLIEAHTTSLRLDQTLQSLIDDLGTDAIHPTDQKNFSSPISSSIDVAIALDRDGKPLMPDSNNPFVKAAKLPSSSLQAILTNLPTQWFSLSTTKPLHLPKGIQAGFLQTSEGLLLLTEQTISQRDRTPIRLITGQWVNPERLKKLGERTLLILRLLPLQDPEVPAPLKSGNPSKIEDYIPKKNVSLDIPRIKEADGLQANPESNLFTGREIKLIAGYVLLRDVKGEPIAVLQAISPKPFATYGEEGVKILLVFLWITIALFGVALNLLLDRWILSRLSHLSDQLKQVKADSPTTQITLPGQDELSHLAIEINAMLQRQASYQENLRLAKQEIETANQELERLACTDGLTQVMNRCFFQIHLEKIWQEALKTAQPLSLLLCDVDFFKLYNDTYGHLAGDLCLQKVAKAMTTVLEQEPTAIVARYGGEEFAAILANTPVSRAIALAEQLRSSVLHLNIPHAKSQAANCVTLSIGICSLVPQAHLCDRDLIARADEHLYQAKAEGRNRVVASRAAIEGDTPLSAEPNSLEPHSSISAKQN